jgi:hypothetical protein
LKKSNEVSQFSTATSLHFFNEMMNRGSQGVRYVAFAPDGIIQEAMVVERRRHPRRVDLMDSAIVNEVARARFLPRLAPDYNGGNLAGLPETPSSDDGGQWPIGSFEDLEPSALGLRDCMEVPDWPNWPAFN